jgi:phytoene desaturase
LKKASIIGGGFAGLSAAAFLAKSGYQVDLFEKHNSLGGRARSFSHNGFDFDMGPSWYWMPDVFERFYNSFGHTTSDFYNLVRLDPSYQVFFQDEDRLKIPADYEALQQLFERYEKGSAKKLDVFLKSAQYKYEVGLGEYVHKPSLSALEFLDQKVLSSFFKMRMFSSLSSEVRALFKNPKLIQLLEFPVLFLGAKPQKTPALYSLMNYADIKLGTWYPMGGMVQIPLAMEKIVKSLGVNVNYNESVQSMNIQNGSVNELITSRASYQSDVVVSSADYHHTEMSMVPSEYRSYSERYWNSRIMAPSSLIFYLGINKKIEGLEHHNLFFDSDFQKHAAEIYDTPQWPSDPLFYVCCPSKTDTAVAPEGSENLFVLIPLAAGIEDSENRRNDMFHIVLDRIKQRIGEDISENIVFKKSFCVNEFVSEYNSFKGNAYGLSNVLMQTAFLKPRMKSKKIKNLLFAGQLTTPGPGVPPSLISGEVAAKYIINQL